MARHVLAVDDRADDGRVGARPPDTPFLEHLDEARLGVTGRWLCEVPELPGVLVYGQSREEALKAVKALALRVVADRIEHGEAPGDIADVMFAVPVAAA